MHRRRATVATPGEWQCGVRRLAVANGPNIFQMLLVLILKRSIHLGVYLGLPAQHCVGVVVRPGLF